VRRKQPAVHSAGRATLLPADSEHVAVVIEPRGGEVRSGDFCEVPAYGRLPVVKAVRTGGAFVCILGVARGRWQYNPSVPEIYALGTKVQLTRLIPELGNCPEWTPPEIEKALMPLEGSGMRVRELGGEEQLVQLDMIGRVEVGEKADRTLISFLARLAHREGF